jgi:hypothetical protein
MDIPAHLKEITVILDQTGSVPALEYVPCKVILMVKIHTVRVEYLLHDLPELHFICLQCNMKMI